ncbi:hypothetical protein CBR_g40960 [Chara braunii]|uniref:phospholipase D n=1 Tax=Chara braunii TaxID=69332 RepID=A0A388LUY2_CHABU|nr:hypothetical protein CBR_g40960 [Chara braunii]|eukprot:GBG86059.1 hypothetical protein CBR_g40960 [Chara braunii]
MTGPMAAGGVGNGRTKEARGADIQGTLWVQFNQAEGLWTPKNMDKGCCNGTLTVYASVGSGREVLASSDIIWSSGNHARQQSAAFHIELSHLPSYFLVAVDLSCGQGLNEHVGTAYIRALSVARQFKEVCGWYSLCSDEEIQSDANARILLLFKFRALQTESDVDLQPGRVLKNDNWVPPLVLSYFFERKGNRVTLFQDAIVPSSFSPNITLENGTTFEQHSMFEQLCESILKARHFIYIVGWDLDRTLVLVRGDRGNPRCRGVTIGELLTQKATEYVKVLFLIWSNKMNYQNQFFDRIGAEIAPDTHSDESCAWFCERQLVCILAERRDTDVTMIPNAFTHHQKMVMLDAPAWEAVDDSESRVVEVYIGGIDLTVGRYDTPNHPLFKTLNTVHKNDMYQPSWGGKSGPRLPWHDIHAKVDGPAAWDMVANFEQRWKTIDPGHDCLPPPNRPEGKEEPTEVLFDFEKHAQFFAPKQARAVPEGDPEAWDVHFVRSIDSASVAGFPSGERLREDPTVAVESGLYIGPDSKFSYEKSIYDLYMRAIQRAEDFLYIENQYFIGSSQYWLENRDVGAVQKIPYQIAQKIVRKIERRENFVVYVVIPMWPAGDPSSSAVREILRWQYDTMSMMYSAVASAIHAQGLADAKPTDYLSFFTLVNREKLPEGFKLTKPSDELNRKAQENCRFPIYIHSKLMIVDDMYIMVGSANINQRSMDGLRDTEADIGAYQPYYTSANRCGQVHGFRMSLWAEHMGTVEEVFRHPSKPECLKRVKEIARANWQQYTAGQVTNMQSHIVPYPITVTEDGEVTHLEGFQNFPDTDANVLGDESFFLPNILTT